MLGVPTPDLVATARRVSPAARPPRPGAKPRTVSWRVPVGTSSILGHRDSGGLVWLLGLRLPSEALAYVLRRALAIDVDTEGPDR